MAKSPEIKEVKPVERIPLPRVHQIAIRESERNHNSNVKSVIEDAVELLNLDKAKNWAFNPATMAFEAE